MNTILKQRKKNHNILLLGIILFTLITPAQGQKIKLWSENFESFSNDMLISRNGTRNFYASNTSIQKTTKSCGAINTLECNCACDSCYRNLWSTSNVGPNNITGKSLGVCVWGATSIQDDDGILNSYNRFTPKENLLTDHYVYFTTPSLALWKDITLDFDWKCLGNGTSNYGTAELRDFSNNATYTFRCTATSSQYFCNKPDSTHEQLLFPTSVNGTDSIRVSFSYYSSAASTPNISFVVDNLVLKACPNNLPILTGNTVINRGDSATIKRDNVYGAYLSAGLSYQWQESTDNINWVNVPGADTILNTGALTQTTYYRSIIKLAPCTDLVSEPVTVSIDIPVCNPPTLEITSFQSRCTTVAAHIFQATSSIATGWEYQWQRGTTVLQPWSANLNYTATNPPAGTYTLLARNREDTACQAEPAVQNFSVNSLVTPTFSNNEAIDTVYCAGDTPKPATLPTISTDNITGVWSISGANVIAINTSIPGTFIYTFTPNSGQCANSKNLTVAVSNISRYTFRVTECDEYRWIDGKTYTESTNTPTYTLTNANGCDSVIVLDLTINKSSATNIRQAVCESYSWNGSVYTTSGIYSDTLTNAFGCDSVVTLDLTVEYESTTDIVAEACYEYYLNNQLYDVSGDYLQTVYTPQAGCPVNTNLHLTIYQPSLSITSMYDLCDSGKVILTAVTNVSDILWSTGDTTPVITANKSGNYTATVTVIPNVCELTESIMIPYCPVDIYLPNVIKAGDYGLNSTFNLHPFYVPMIATLELHIYNRWGSLVYHSKDIEFSWSGEEKGKIYSADGKYQYNEWGNNVYAYVMTVFFKDGREKRYAGHVTVL